MPACLAPSTCSSGGAGGIGSRGECRRGRRRVAAELSGDGEHVAFGGDLTVRETNRRLVHEATARGTVSVIVNAVGISPKAPDGTKRAFHEITEDEWDRVMGVDVKSPLLLPPAPPTRPRRPPCRTSPRASPGSWRGAASG